MRNKKIDNGSETASFNWTDQVLTSEEINKMNANANLLSDVGISLFVKKVEEISPGKRLTELINERYERDKDFCKDLSFWLSDETNNRNQKGKPYVKSKSKDEVPYIYESRISEYKKGMPINDDRIEMFSRFFNVDPEYLKCTQIEKHKKNINNPFTPKRIEQLKEQFEKIEYLRNFLLEYSFDIMPNIVENNNSYRFISDNCIYEISGAIDPKIESYKVLSPKQDIIEMNENQLNCFMDELAKYAEYLLWKNNDNSGHKD